MIAIAITSFREALKKKIILLTFLLTIIYLILYTIFAFFLNNEFSKADTNKLQIFSNFSSLITILGLYFSSMIIAFLTIMASIGAVSNDVESGIIHAVITKPIKRVEYILGKFFGLAFLIIVYSIFMYSADIFIPYLIGGPSIDVIGFLPILKGLIFFIFEPLVILSFCIFGGIYFKTLSNGIFVVSIYILGTIGGMVEQFGNFLNIRSLINWGIISSLISPFDVIYRKIITTVFASFGISPQLLGPMFLTGSEPSIWMMLYALILSAGLVFITIRKFNRLDLG